MGEEVKLELELLLPVVVVGEQEAFSEMGHNNHQNRVVSSTTTSMQCQLSVVGTQKLSILMKWPTIATADNGYQSLVNGPLYRYKSVMV